MNNFYCAAPWRGLHINPRGDVKTCCAGDPNMLGNLNTNTITEVLDNSVMVKVRASLAQGQAHEYCSNCVQAERLGADSERVFFDQALKTYAERRDIVKVSDVDISFWKHIYDIEHRYHPDKSGEFVRLWPELEFLCK